MGVKHKAFLDLEQGLASRLKNAWSREFAPLGRQIQTAINDRNFDKAHDLAEQIDAFPVIKRNEKFAETLSMSALLLGASRLKKPNKSVVYQKPPLEIIKNAINQLEIMIARNATLALRKEAHLWIHEAEDEARNAILKAESQAVRAALTVNGHQYFLLASSLHISRLSSFGFMAEASESGLETYEISEILDDRTCPVCEFMHGQVFPLSAGMSHASMIMNASDPDTMKNVAPFPPQSRGAVVDLQSMSIEELIDHGYTLPPFHPGCRGIIIRSGESVDTSFQSAQNRESLTAQALYGVKDPVILGQRLLGDFNDLEEDAEESGVQLSAFALGTVLAYQAFKDKQVGEVKPLEDLDFGDLDRLEKTDMSYWDRWKLQKYNPYHDEEGKFTSKENAVAKSANQLYERARNVESKVTEVLHGVEDKDSHLEGLQFRLKTVDSLTRKIGTEARLEGISPEEKAAQISDSLRYTLVVSDEKYVDKVNETLNVLEKQGFTVSKFKNYWDQNLEDDDVPIYQGVNVNLKTSYGVKMELQFHTSKSYQTKENLNHPLYEKYRKPDTPDDEREKAFNLMKENQRNVSVPQGVVRLRR